MHPKNTGRNFEIPNSGDKVLVELILVPSFFSFHLKETCMARNIPSFAFLFLLDSVLVLIVVPYETIYFLI